MSQVKDQAQKPHRYPVSTRNTKIIYSSQEESTSSSFIYTGQYGEGKQNYGGKRGRFRLLAVSDESSDGESSDSDQMNDDNGDGKEVEERKEAANHVLNGVERGTADKS